MNDRVQEWQSWIEHGGPIYIDVLNMNYRRILFRGFMNGVRSRFLSADNDALLDLSFAAHYQKAYWTEQALAIRRQTDTNDSSAYNYLTLRRLFDEITDQPDLVGFDHYAEVAGGDRWDSIRTYAHCWGGLRPHESDERMRQRTSLDVASWKHTRRNMITKSNPVRQRVGKTVAHADEDVLFASEPLEELFPASILDLHKAMKAITKAFQSAYALLTGAAIEVDLMPIGPDYRAPFRVPIFREGYGLPQELGPFHDETEDEQF